MMDSVASTRHLAGLKWALPRERFDPGLLNLGPNCVYVLRPKISVITVTRSEVRSTLVPMKKSRIAIFAVGLLCGVLAVQQSNFIIFVIGGLVLWVAAFFLNRDSKEEELRVENNRKKLDLELERLASELKALEDE